jgi:hypothetical protein
MPPQTPQAQNAGLPSQVTAVTPSQASPPKTTPKSVVKALPTVRDHTTDQLGPEGDEYIPREYDESGEKKVSQNGQLNDNREYRCRTFFVPNRGEKLFMLATECARVLGYRDSYLLFNKNRSLYKIIATQAEKEDLIHQEILPFSYRSRQIAIVTAKSMFRQFGSRVIVNGRRVRDDYWESKARKQGFTEDDLAGEKRPGGAKARDAAAAEASANASAILGHHGDIVYSNAPAHFGAHPVPQTVQPGMIGAVGGVTPLPMITLAPDQSDMRLGGDYRNVPRPRQEITGPAYQDRTQTSPPTELLTQSHHAAEFNKSVTQQRSMRGKYIDGIWRQPHEPPATVSAPVSGTSEHLPPVTQPLQAPHSGASGSQQPMLSNPGPQHRQAYSQASHQQNPLAQTPMRGMPSNSMQQEQLHGRSPSMSLQSGGMGQNAYGFAPQQSQMWPPPQPQQSPQHGFPGYNTHGAQQPSHLQQASHQTPTPLRHNSSNPQLQSTMQYQGMPNMGQGYPTPGRGLYQPEQSPQQYMPQNQPGPQPGAQGWSPQHPTGQGNWGWSGQGQ